MEKDVLVVVAVWVCVGGCFLAVKQSAPLQMSPGGCVGWGVRTHKKWEMTLRVVAENTQQSNKNTHTLAGSEL